MCKTRYCSESGSYDDQECPDFLKLCDEFGDAKDYFKEILESLYSERELDTAELEHYLIELSDVLDVRYPQNKILNLRSKC